MAKLYFRYGAMGSSKTANALMVRYNYEEKGQHAVLLKPRFEKRDGESLIRSRIGLEAKALFAEDFLEENRARKDWKGIAAIIVDECHFLDPAYIDLLASIVDNYDIPVLCYGLRTDFTGVLFAASKRLMELADRIEEVPTVCWCGRRAHFNARFVDGKIVRSGEQFMLGANDSYTSLCRKHFMEGRLRPDQ